MINNISEIVFVRDFQEVFLELGQKTNEVPFASSTFFLKPKTKIRWLDLLQPSWLIQSDKIHYRGLEAYRMFRRAKEPSLRVLAKYSASRRNDIGGSCSLPLHYCSALDIGDSKL